MKNKDKTKNPHDHLARKMFGRPDVAAGFFKAYLPEVVANYIQVEKLHCEPVSFVDEALRGSVADLLYRMEDEDNEMLFYLLFEHQSQPDSWMPLRLLKYMVRIWEKFRSGHPKAKKLPPILPIILHQGKSGWTVAQSFKELIHIPNGMGATVTEALPDFSFSLVDLSGIPFTKLKGHFIGILTLQALKAGAEDRMEEFWEASEPLWRELMNVDAPLEIARTLFRYLLFTDTSVDKQVFQDSVKKLESTSIGKTGMTLAQQFIEEGREEGQREIVLRMNASGMDVEQIVAITGITKAKVLSYLSFEE